MVLTYEETMADCEARGRAEGEARGRAEGEARGRAEGRRTAAREAVVRVLEYRWPPVPVQVLSQLEAIEDLARLGDLLTEALEARSIGDLDLSAGQE